MLRLLLKLAKPEISDDYLKNLKPYSIIGKRAKQLVKGIKSKPTIIDGLLTPLRNSLSNVDQTVKQLNNYFKVIFVRNPLDRLLSAWKDRLIDNEVKPFPQLNLKIIEQYRNGTNDQSTNKATLLEFFLFLNDSDQTRSMNHHWTPMYQVCHVCAVNYDFIGKMETMEQDMKLFIQQIRPELSGKIDIPRDRPPIAIEDDERYQLLKKTVPQQLARQVLNKYQIDYKLFGYDMDWDLKRVYG